MKRITICLLLLAATGCNRDKSSHGYVDAVAVPDEAHSWALLWCGMALVGLIWYVRKGGRNHE